MDGPDKPIVVGVDGSEESARAARVGWMIARAIGTECHYVHAVRDRWTSVRDLARAAAATVSASPLTNISESLVALSPKEQAEIRQRLTDLLPEDAADHLRIEVGRSSTVLAHAVDDLHAEMLVVGGKRHATLGRWVVGSTAHDLVRTMNVPMLVVGDAPGTLGRILVAVDLSPQAKIVLRYAEELAARFEAALMALHVVDDVPAGAEGFSLSPDELMARAREIAEERLWSAIALSRAETSVRSGKPVDVIKEELKNFDADIAIVGSHGHGWDGRMLLGGTTEALLDDLPASLLVVPVT